MKKILIVILASMTFFVASCSEKREKIMFEPIAVNDSMITTIPEIPKPKEIPKPQEIPAPKEEPKPKEIPKPKEEQKPQAPIEVKIPKKTQNSGQPLKDIIICVDAGHGLNSYNKEEPIAPNSGELKQAFASGTKGATYTEEQLTLIVAKKLELKLQELGALVHMTRTQNESDMTNIDRAEFANNINADISIKIHADGSNNSSAKGISMLVPTNDYIGNQSICDQSMQIGEIVLNEVINQTGAKSRGVVKRRDLTGFNWTKVPIVLIEMGFMTNPIEDAQLSNDDYQNAIVQGIADGLAKYYSIAT